uniref:Uncharacterized protein n=1 Tax=Candidozyma auris TaxID=498019 RepID=A0A0L0P8Z4_CANAR
MFFAANGQLREMPYIVDDAVVYGCKVSRQRKFYDTGPSSFNFFTQTHHVEILAQ